MHDLVERLRAVLAGEPAVAYALLFGSAARTTAHAGSDVDIAVEFVGTARPDTERLGSLTARLESVAGRSVDLLCLEGAPSPLAYRVFRDGRVIVDRDHAALVRRKARAIVEYLDFKPVEDRCADGVLRAASRG